MQLLTQVPSVANLTALAYLFTLGDPRFGTSRVVEPYLGLGAWPSHPSGLPLVEQPRQVQKSYATVRSTSMRRSEASRRVSLHGPSACAPISVR